MRAVKPAIAPATAFCAVDGCFCFFCTGCPSPRPTTASNGAVPRCGAVRHSSLWDRFDALTAITMLSSGPRPLAPGRGRGSTAVAVAAPEGAPPARSRHNSARTHRRACDAAWWAPCVHLSTPPCCLARSLSIPPQAPLWLRSRTGSARPPPLILGGTPALGCWRFRVISTLVSGDSGPRPVSSGRP